MKKYIIALLISLFTLVPGVAKAHCPLCTAGAGALAVFAATFGVSTMAIGVFVGAFSVALGLWMAKIAKKWKQRLEYQSTIIAVLVAISTVLPMLPLVSEYMSVNIYWFGSYGNPFNRTYLLHTFLTGTLIGALIMLSSPYISSWAKRLRGGKLIPYQGIVITLVLLISVSLAIQFVL